MTIATNAEAVRTAGNAWSRARIYDDKLGEPDAARIALWAESIAKWELDAPDVLSAVTAYYEGEKFGRTIQIGDLLHHAREIRRDRAEREKAREIVSPPDPQLGGLPIGGADGEPVWDAYDEGCDGRAIDRTCPTCGSEPSYACLNTETGMTRKIPCIARLLGKTLPFRRSA